MSRRTLPGIALALVAATALAGCSPTAEAGGGDASGEPVTGGTLTFAEPVPYDNFFAENSIWSTSQILNNLTDRLTWQNPETGEIEPWIAESWEVDGSGTAYTFHLRDDVTFSDGSVLDAANVKANYDKFGLGDESRGIPQHRYFAGYASSEVVDDDTVVIHLESPNAGFLQVTSTYLTGLVSNATLELDRDAQGLAENVHASGPFVLGEVADDLSSVVLEAREDYDWAPASAGHQGRAYLDSIEFTNVPEDSVRTGLVLSGDADVARAVQPDDEELLRGGGTEFVYVPVLGDINGLYANLTQPLTEELEVRQALQAATDREEIRDTIYNEHYGVARSVVPSNDPYFVDFGDDYLAYDIDRARELLESAGFAEGSDGIYARDGERLSFTVTAPVYYPRSKQTLELVSQQWLRAGIELLIRQADAGTAATAAATDPLRQGQNSRADIDFLRSQYSTATANVLKDTPEHGAELDALLDAQALATSDDERAGIAADIQELMLAQAVRIPLYEETQVFALNPRVQGFGTERVARAWFYDTWLAE